MKGGGTWKPITEKKYEYHSNTAGIFQVEGKAEGEQFIIASMRKPGGNFIEDALERRFRFQRCMTKGAMAKLFDVAEVCEAYGGA